MNMIKNRIEASIQVKQMILNNQALLERINTSAEKVVACLQEDGKILFCGNGGSAADAQHIAAELSGRFYKDRDPLFAEALHVNTSYLTAVANDYSYHEIYARLVKAKGRKNDVLFCISTSGNSENILKAAQKAHHQGMFVIGMTGESGGLLKDQVDILLNMPSSDTPRIQEAHILIGHIICEITEQKLFG